MRNTTVFAAAVAALAIPLAAWAYTHGKPGLWQVSTQMTFTKGGPQIPPDKLAMMKQMGIQLPGMGTPVTSNVCITPEQANTDTPPAPDQQRECQMQNLKRDGRSFSADMVCSGEMQGTGHMSVTYDSDEHYSGRMQFAGKSAHTGEMEMNNEFSGQFKSADCGAVKPFSPKK